MYHSRWTLIPVVVLLLISSSLKAQDWEQVGWQGDIYGDILYVTGEKIFAITGSSTNTQYNPGDSIIISADNGFSWATILSISEFRFYDVPWKKSGNIIYGIASSQIDNQCLVRSTDEGNTWSKVVKLPPDYQNYGPHISGIYPDGDTVFLTGDRYSMITIDGGKSWSELPSLGQNILYKNGIIYQSNGQIMKISSDFGRTWSEESLPFNVSSVSEPFSLDNIIVVICNDTGTRHLYYRDVNKRGWFLFSKLVQLTPNLVLEDNSIYYLLASPTSGNYYSQVFISTDKGIIWKEFGSPNYTVSSEMFVGSEYIFLPSQFALLRIPKPMAPAIVKEENSRQSLYAFPNPSSDAANISFNITERAFTTLDIYDVLGRRVTRLAEKTFDPGNYNIPFDTHTLSTGTYFYRLTVGNSSVTNELVIKR
jgi:hypothetical protein